MIRSAIKPIASLRLTVFCLGIGMVLVFAATLDQVELGIHAVEKKYFQSLFALWKIPGASFGDFHFGYLPLPGGYLLGGILLVNLLAAHVSRFKMSWKKSGILMIHAGVILLILGEIFRGVFADETRMRLDEGATSNYSEALREVELAIVDTTSDSQHDKVVTIPQRKLREGQIQHPSLPFTVHIHKHFPNSEILPRHEVPNAPPSIATTGFGVQHHVEPRPRATKIDERDLVSTFVELRSPHGTLGTWLLSNVLDEQSFVFEGVTYELSVRGRRDYKPFSIKLLDFSHDKYAGTEIPKNFSSRVILQHPETGEDREVLIYMNNPLRYGGYTFYQASFANADTTSILQVVKNPAWLMPYFACGLVAVGLLVQFSFHLLRFASGTRPKIVKDAEKKNRQSATWLIVGLLVTLFVCWGYLKGSTKKSESLPGIDQSEFGNLPVLHKGRVKPMDTLARTSLLIIHGKQRLRLEDGEKLAAISWLLELLYDPSTANTRQVFRIDNAEVLSLIGQKQGDRKNFAATEIDAYLPEINRQAVLASQVEPQLRSPFQRQVIKLHVAVDLYSRIQYALDRPSTEEIDAFNSLGAEMQASALALEGKGGFLPVRPTAGSDAGKYGWRTIRQAVFHAELAGEPDPDVAAYIELEEAFRAGDTGRFNQVAAELRESLRDAHPGELRRVGYEKFFNQLAPFYLSMVLYVVAFLLACAFWLLGRPGWSRAGMMVLCFSIAIHVLGLASRMFIEGRPPVTNLYSSAVFVGLGAVIMGAVLERLFRNGVGTATASIIGFLTLLIAHHLSLAGDTMEMMRAVLDSNLWLATHVVVVTLGYSATFLAGTLALIYILRKYMFGQLDAATGKSLGRMVYGIICFATLFSFVGTILGGIWADQSWGRFWGWDPKENGALLIVIWNAIILHARWGGMVRERGLMVLAVFGSIVTSWSWFGTNMLGVGLHAYGFTDAAFFWLVTFMASQIIFMGFGIWGPVKATDPAKNSLPSVGDESP